jgi:drug/metabolite transporter (DMT)-like permease
MFRRVGQRPVPAVLVGAVGLAFSGILFRLSHVSASTGAFYRCVWALAPLFVLAATVGRRQIQAPEPELAG